MANRENQGLQVALILFVMITVVLAVTTYIYFRKAEEVIVEINLANETARVKEQGSLRVIEENENLKSLLGYTPEDEWATIKANFDKDMQLYGQEFPEDQRNYRTLPDYLIVGLVKVQKEMVEAAAGQASVVAAKDSAAQASTARAETLAQAGETYKTDMEALRTSTAKTLADKNTEMTTLVNQVNDIQTKAQTAIELKNKDIQQLEQQIQALTKLVNSQKEMLEGHKKPTFDRPAGAVTFVSTTSTSVYIDLGSADGLKRQITFSVYDAATTNIVEENKKANIEVINILGPHQAEARIVSSDDRDPILKGDKIFSPVWRPGQKTHFALVGFIDINGDGTSDLPLIRNLIALNGGVIDADVDERGKVSGALSINTQYLVLGDPPTETSSAEGLQSYTELQKQAALHGVEKISVERLLANMGYRGAGATAPAAGGTLAPGNPAGAPAGTSQPFRPRTPPARGAGGAY